MAIPSAFLPMVSKPFINMVPLTGPTSLCCAKAYCFARYTRKALGLKTPHWGVFFTASPLSGPIPISKNTGYPDGVSGILVPLTGIEPVQYFYRGILSPLRLPIPPQRQAVEHR